MKFSDLKGRKFGRLIVLRLGAPYACGGRRWFCQCICGKEKLIAAGNLLQGMTQSCGCLHKERFLAAVTTPEAIEKSRLKRLGRKCTEEQKQKFSLSHLGQTPWNKGKKNVMPAPWNKGTVGVVKAWNKGKRSSAESKEKMRQAKLGKKLSDEHKKNLFLAAKRGDAHYNWHGGISKEGYPHGFNRALKARIRERDNYTCQRCGRSEAEERAEFNRVLCVNHIDFNKTNIDENNLNALCHRCNASVNYRREFWSEYFQQFQTCSP